MCGISGGWFHTIDPDRLRASMQLLVHRGPDGSGEYFDETSGVALGHRRLAIIDLSAAGHQPMHSDDGKIVLTYNGELYNYRELRLELEDSGVVFRGTSDTEVLLRLYIANGIAMLPRLEGIFAFALHDKSKGELLLARDAMGVKPLYYCSGSNGFAFASEIKALLSLTGQSGPLDAASLHRYLTYLWCPGEGTPLKDVRKLAPGAAMRIRDCEIAERWNWYTLPSKKPVRRWLTKGAAILKVRDLLRTAVHDQLVADVPVGAFLSGGLDSSAITAFAREQVPDLHCFTIEPVGGADRGEADDLPYARKVAKHLGVRLDAVPIEPDRMAAELERMVWQLDEPLADPAPLNVMYISNLAREAGIKVLLSGAGGDDLFTGYRRHLALRLENLWSWLPGSIRHKLDSTAGNLDQQSVLGRRLGRLFLGAGERDDVRLAAYFAWARRDDLMALYNADMKAALSGQHAHQPLVDFLEDFPPDRSRLDKMLALEQRFFLTDHNLNYTDKMSMAAGVEVRVPFLDLELVELAARIPDRYKQRGRVAKWVLKKAMEPYLPKDVIYRPKTGFGAPLRRWMRHDLRDLMGDLLSKESLLSRNLFDPAAVQSLIADNDAGRRDAAYTLFSLMCIEIWCRRFVDADFDRLPQGSPKVLQLQ